MRHSASVSWVSEAGLHVRYEYSRPTWSCSVRLPVGHLWLTDEPLGIDCVLNGRAYVQAMPPGPWTVHATPTAAARTATSADAIRTCEALAAAAQLAVTKNTDPLDKETP